VRAQVCFYVFFGGRPGILISCSVFTRERSTSALYTFPDPLRFLVQYLKVHFTGNTASAAPHGPASPAVYSQGRWDKFTPQCTPSVLLAAISIQYNDGIPKGSRFDANSELLKETVKKLQKPEGQEKLRKVRELTKLAEEGRSLPGHPFHVKLNHPIELNKTVSALTISWVAKNPNTSTVILGASNPEQVTQTSRRLR